MSTSLFWFRQDLRLADNPALFAAAQAGKIILVYILDDENPKNHSLGEASRWWLHHSLQSLHTRLNGNLLFFRGDATKIISTLCHQLGINSVHWNRCYEPWRIQRDKKIKEQLIAQNISAQSYNGSLLFEPWEGLKADNTPYQIFTPFYRNLIQKNVLSEIQTLPIPQLHFAKINKIATHVQALTLEQLNLLPKINWYQNIEQKWEIGEIAAQNALDEFLDMGIEVYQQARDFPALEHTSKLSPYLHWGEISPKQIWHQLDCTQESGQSEAFKRQLIWREFAHSLLFYHPELPSKGLKPQFDQMPWKKNHHHLCLWQKGLTGYPIIDAGMRELWQTGYMHNRVRMLVASFLVKNLFIDWREGAHWFWDCLLDANLANNSASWQWVAGCGTDCAPYFRIFNPITQGEKFDAKGEYTRKFVPELAKMPNKYLFKPWLAPKNVLQQANVELGKNYPLPMVDIQLSRTQALEAYHQMKSHIS